MKTAITLLLLLSNTALGGQNLNFVDEGLKDYLLHELCVDTTISAIGIGEMNMDLNGDDEIQLSEADQVTRLMIEDFGNNYSIHSVQDLRQFRNLRWLKLVQLEAVEEIAQLGLDSLRALWIGTNRSLRVIDLSDLTALSESLKIEDINTLEYLNLKNGSIPELFSLFYSRYFHYACVDSIAAEYEQVEMRMPSGAPALENCLIHSGLDITGTDQSKLLHIFPNPNNGFLNIETSLQIENLMLFDVAGKLLIHINSATDSIDLSHLPSGLYIFKLNSPDGSFSRKIIKQ